VFIVDVYAVLELCIPVFATSTLAVITVPDAFNLVAVMLSIISMFATVAPLIKISSNLILEKMDVFYTNTNILEKRMQENVNIIKNPTSNLKLFRKKKQKDIILDIMSIN